MMRVQMNLLLTVALTTLAAASPTWQSLQEWATSSLGKPAPEHRSSRPEVSCHPFTPRIPMPVHPPRTKVCYVQSHNNGEDDSPYILDALHHCNNGGHVVFVEGVKYVIGTALNLTFLEHIDIGM